MTGNETHVGFLLKPVRVILEAGEEYEKGTGFYGTGKTTGETRYGIFVAHEELVRTGKQATGKPTGQVRQRGVL